MRTLRAPAISGITMQQTESNWNFGRFAKTFGFFNGNPLLKLIPFVPSGSPSVPQPAAVAAGNELILWNFEGMDQVIEQVLLPHLAAAAFVTAGAAAAIL